MRDSDPTVALTAAFAAASGWIFGLLLGALLL